jgi:predicted outer membrane repeat protein
MKRSAMFLTVLGVILVGQLQAATYTVGPPGGGYNYTTITAALAGAVDGDTIRVAATNYSAATGEAFPLTIDKALVVEGMNSTNRAHVQGDGTNTVLLITSANVTNRNLWLSGGRGSEGIYAMDGGGVCIFVDANAEGAVVIDNCVIESNTCPSDQTYEGCGAGIYCGGTWCTCFEVGILNSLIRGNTAPGDGGGVFCGMLSKVWIENSRIESNVATNRGGGLFVDAYAVSMLKHSTNSLNSAQGNPNKPNWGGGGGIYQDGASVCTVADSVLSSNTATYFGGGLFTLSGISTQSVQCADVPTNATWRFFTPGTVTNAVVGSFVGLNHAGSDGGGAYVGDNAYEAFQNTTLYWNDAQSDGGGVYVAGGASGGKPPVEFLGGCLLEGNECQGTGGGVCLDTNRVGRFAGSRFIGNSALSDGGAVMLGAKSASTFTNCLLAYNNSARGSGGGLRLGPGATNSLLRCSVVGNFAPWGRNAVCLSSNAVSGITNSILWRNAGGAIQTNQGSLKIAYSLNEDGTGGPGVIAGSPSYVGWGTNTTIFVNAAATPGPGLFTNLQVALTNFDFRLGTNSSCLTAGSDGGFIGADNGSGGAAGNVAAALQIAGGSYDIRGRSIIFTRGLQGAGRTSTTIRNAVFGYIENAWVNDLGITGETIFGGIMIRADVGSTNFQVYATTALGDGGGVLITAGRSTFQACYVSGNYGAGRGGGVFVGTNLWTGFWSSTVQNNQSGDHGGGLFCDTNSSAYLSTSQVLTNTGGCEGGGIYAGGSNIWIVAGSLIQGNASVCDGGGLMLYGSALIDASQVRTNTSASDGGGAYVRGNLVVTNNSQFTSNRVFSASTSGGGMYAASTANVAIYGGLFFANRAQGNVGLGGAVRCDGPTFATNVQFLANYAEYGGAIYTGSAGTPVCYHCVLSTNYANQHGGALFCDDNSSPHFFGCKFEANYGRTVGGVGRCDPNSQATFEDCSFVMNSSGGDGGCFRLQNTATLWARCGFTNNSATYGGVLRCYGTDASRVVASFMRQSRATTSAGGTIYMQDTCHPLFVEVTIADSVAATAGGGVAVYGTAYPTFQDTAITNCSAVTGGGGVYAEGSSASAFERCTFQNNWTANGSGSDGGGANFTAGAAGRFSCCRFVGNSANDDGGGVAVSTNAAISATNTFFINNRSTNSGGGLYFTLTGKGLLQNCTLSGNSAGAIGGGGIYLDSSTVVSNDSSIIYGNLPDGIRQSGGSLSVQYSCVQAAIWPGSGNITNNPLLDPATAALLDGSPCIDAGNPALALNDGSLPPGKGTVRNDMGASGGPLNCCGQLPTTGQGLRAYYQFEGNVLDSSGNNYHGAAMNVAYTTGRVGALAAQFDGTSAYVSIPRRVGTNFTIALWVKTTDTGGSGQWYAGKGLVDGHLSGTADDFGTALVGGHAAFGVGNPNTTVTSITLINDNQWHHVAATRDAGSGLMKLYVDGVVENLLVGPAGPKTSPGTLRIGALGAVTNFLPGAIDDVQIYDRALTDVEIAAIFSPVRGLITPAYNAGQHVLGLSFYARRGQSYTLLASTDIAASAVNWTVVTNWLGNDSMVQFTDSAPATGPARFYHLRTP